MLVSDIKEADLTALKAEGYTEADLGALAESEVQALLASDGGSDGPDPHDVAAAQQDAAKAAPAAQAAPEPEPEPAPFVPQYKAEVPADAAEQIKALRQEERAAFKRLMDGEIDADEYQTVRDRTDTEADALKTKALTASIFEQANQQTQAQVAEAEWKRAQMVKFSEFKAEGIDYRDANRPGLLAAFNHHLKALAADPKNERRDGQWFLGEAHRLTKADLGLAAAQANKPQPRVVDSAEIPPTLRGVPAAATGAVNADEFAHMRGLEGLALERAHAALTDAQRDRWMAE
jgi:hypothetical protein